MKLHPVIAFLLLLAFVFSPHEALARHRHHAVHHHSRHHHAYVDSGAPYSDIVIDADTGRIIHQTNAYALRHPASLTKMMTLYLTFQAIEDGRLSLDQYLPVSENASYKEPSKLGLRAGSRIRVQDAILGIVTESANDAATVLGEALGGSEEGFGRLMTKQARALGMTDTFYHNPSGLPDPAQVTTAHDMAILGAALINHYPRFYPYFSRDSFTYAGIYHHNHNHLMDRYEGMDGIKTGYIRASGFNLVASAKRDGVRLIGVIFGGHSAVARDNRMAHLLDDSFDVAEADARSGRMSSAVGEGDGVDNDDADYVTLPAKVAAIFPPRGATSGDQTADNDGGSADAATPVAQSAPRPSRKPSGKNWGIQIGAYSDPAIGQQALTALIAGMPDQLNNSISKVEKISAGGTTMYRARLMGLDKRTAQGVCSYLIQHNKSCLTVEP